MRPWIASFVDKVESQKARQLLKPMEEAHEIKTGMQSGTYSLVAPAAFDCAIGH
jgi:hypothetical protein